MRVSVKHRQVDRTTLNAHIAEMYERAGRRFEEKVYRHIDADNPETATNYLGKAEGFYRKAAEHTK